MPGVGFAERYVIARESNVVRVDFARRPDPPAPRFPGAGGLRPATWRVTGTDCGKLRVFRLRQRVGVLGCVVSPSPQFVHASGQGVAPAFELLRAWLGFGQERRKRSCGSPCFRSPSSSPLP
jgi:hypothetical protein